jgi:hypothetical protein
MAKVEVNLKGVFKKISQFQRTAINALQRPLKREIVASINRGFSPVAGQGRFAKYSTSYKRSIKRGQYSQFSKRRSPVNLRLSGKLLASIFSKRMGRKLVIGFDNELADIHTNKGAGKSKTIRKMLPQGNERLSKSIRLRLQQVLDQVARKIFR